MNLPDSFERFSPKNPQRHYPVTQFAKQTFEHIHVIYSYINVMTFVFTIQSSVIMWKHLENEEFREV